MFYNFMIVTIISAVVINIKVTSASVGLYTHIDEENESKIEFAFPKYPPHLLDGKLGQIDQDLAECAGINILEITISKLQKLFEYEKLKSLQLTQCYLERIRRMDPYLHAVIEINPDAERIAEKMDLERKKGRVRGVLHGIPILIKDNIATTDKMQTTAGSLALLGLIPRHEATVVKKLRRAGAVILGKTNLSEFAYFRGSGIPSGWSSRGNQTFCPYVLSKDPSGSSTGSAVATAANMAVFALGTETDGSIISPSHHQSLVGLKTTHGLVSTTGVIPISATQDTVGPITRSVSDAALVLNEISETYFKFYTLKRKFRIGVLRDPFWKNGAEQHTKLEEALVALERSSSITLVDPVQAGPGLIFSITGAKERVVMLHEFKVGINKYLADTDEESSLNNKAKRARVRTLADIIAFNTAHPVPEGYPQNLLTSAQDTDGLKNETYLRMRKDNMRAAKGVFATTLGRYRLDAIVTPSEQPNAKNISDHSFTVAAVAGYPSITVPVGFTSDNLPFGITFMGAANSENVLLNIAGIMEYKLQARRRPKFLP